MKGIHHVAVLVTDLTRAEAFYVGVLGLPVLRRWDEGGQPRSVWLGLGEDDETFLALERASCGERAPGGQPGWHCVALGIEVSERGMWRARLSAAGFPVEKESAYTLYVRDPDGALVALSHFPSEHSEHSEQV